MKQLLAVLLIVLLLLTTCGHNPPSGRGATPEEATIRVVQKIEFEPANIMLHGSRITPYGTAVLYTAGQGTDSAAMGFVLTQQHGSAWTTRDVVYTHLTGWIRNTRYVDVSSQVMDINGRVGATYGQVLDPKVAAVEATFDNRQVLRDAVTPEGMFVLMTDNSAGYCTVKVLDAQSQVLETINHPDQSRC